MPQNGSTRDATQNRAPPGLDSELVGLFSGGNENANWRELTRFKPFTNVFVCDKRRGRILLGMKKRGFGKGMYNGFGGKVESNESPIEAAARELEEEAGISANIEECGILLFVNASTEYCHYVHMYRAYEYEGEPTETEEMHPHWFSIPHEYLKSNPAFQDLDLGSPNASSSPPKETLSEIPYDRMWPDDELWMPLLLKDDYFVGRVDFGINNEDAAHGSWAMEKWWFGTKRVENT